MPFGYMALNNFRLHVHSNVSGCSEGSSTRADGGEGELPDPPLLLEVTDLDGISLPSSEKKHVFQSAPDPIGVHVSSFMFL